MSRLRLWIGSLNLKTNLWLAGLFSSIGHYFLSKAMRGLQDDAEAIARDIHNFVNESNSRLH